MLKKCDVTARLSLSNVQSSGFKAYIKDDTQTNRTELTNLYVGKTIECYVEDNSNAERFDCFYYTYNDGSNVIEEIINADANGKFTLKITSDLLKIIHGDDYAGEYVINLGVKTVNQYSLNVKINGVQNLSQADYANIEYIAENGFAVNYIDYIDGADYVLGTDYILGTYVDVNTIVKLTVVPEVVGKYNVDCNGTVANQIENIIQITENLDYVITISPKQYSVEVLENLYSSLEQVDNNNPDIVVDGEQVNNITSSGLNYKDTAIIEFTHIAYKNDGVTKDRALTVIYITNNDSDQEIVINIINNADGSYSYNVTADGEPANLVDLGYSLANSTTSNKLKLTCTTYNNISLRFDYTEYKIINLQ